MRLTALDPAAFLRQHWQKKPLLIRSAWDNWRNPLRPDELAGLACEAEVESRLITGAANAPSLEHGPFPESRFAALGHGPWTLLVQAVDHHVPAVAALLDAFRFIPNWRIDDVMVSYASDGGGVGPHFDQYDVFLVQGLGRRRWHIGGPCGPRTELRPHDDLRLLADFQPIEQWVLEAGDILYLPPGVAHDGIAVGDDCMTYSIGFRAPSRAELIEDWAESLVDTLEEDDRYSDPDLALQTNPGAISPAAIERAQRMIAEALGERERFACWFGGHVTSPKSRELDWSPEEPITAGDLDGLAANGVVLLRNPASRFAFVRRDAAALWLFVDGERFACAGAAAQLAERLCAGSRLTLAAEAIDTPDAAVLLVELYNRGSVAFET